MHKLHFAGRLTILSAHILARNTLTSNGKQLLNWHTDWLQMNCRFVKHEDLKLG